MRTLIELSQECEECTSIKEVLEIRKEHNKELCSYISSIQDEMLISNAIHCHDNIMKMFMLKMKSM